MIEHKTGVVNFNKREKQLKYSWGCCKHFCFYNNSVCLDLSTFLIKVVYKQLSCGVE